MERGSVQRIWDELHDRLGEDLRAVTAYVSDGFETATREDARARYTASDDRAIVGDTIVRQLLLEETEAAFEAGDVEAVTIAFEEALVISRPHPDDSKRGLLVSVQRRGAGTAGFDDAFRYLDGLAWDWLE